MACAFIQSRQNRPRENHTWKNSICPPDPCSRDRLLFLALLNLCPSCLDLFLHPTFPLRRLLCPWLFRVRLPQPPVPLSCQNTARPHLHAYAYAYVFIRHPGLRRRRIRSNVNEDGGQTTSARRRINHGGINKPPERSPLTDQRSKRCCPLYMWHC